MLQKTGEQREMGQARFFLELHRPYSGPVYAEEYGRYNFGHVRSIEQYMEFAGLSNPDKLEDRCFQLHWVPYRDAAEIEELVPGYRMLPEDLTAVHRQEPPPVTQAAGTQQKLVLGRGRPRPAQLGAGAGEAKAGSGAEPQGSVRLRLARVDSLADRRVVLEVDSQFLYICMVAMGMVWVSVLLVLVTVLRTTRGRGRGGSR